MTRYEIHYRLVTVDADDTTNDRWTRYDDQPGIDAESVTITGLDLGESYDLRIRAVDDVTGEVSDWTYLYNHEVEKDAGVPPAARSLRLTKGDCLTWELDEEVIDLRGYLVRHCPGEHGGYQWGWGTAERAHEGILTAAPFLLCRVPKGRRTFLVRPVDWDGNEGDATVLTADRGPVDDQGEFSVRSFDEQAASFGGGLTLGATAPATTLSATVVSGSYTAPGIEPVISIDPSTPAIPFGGSEVAIGSVWGGEAPTIPLDGTVGFDTLYQWIEYVWSFTVQSGEEGPRAVLSVDVTVVSAQDGREMPWRLMYRLRCDLPAIPLDPFAEAIPSTASDEAIPDQTSRPWHPWPGRLLGAARGQYEFRLLVPGGHEQAKVTGLSVTVSSEARVEHSVGLAVPALGGTRAAASTPWRKIQEVRVTPVSVSTATDAPVVDKAPGKGPALRTFQSGTEVATVVDVAVRGY